MCGLACGWGGCQVVGVWGLSRGGVMCFMVVCGGFGLTCAHGGGYNGVIRLRDKESSQAGIAWWPLWRGAKHV